MSRPAVTAPATTFTPNTDRAALTQRALETTISGQPLPEAVRPATVKTPRPASVEAGLKAIVGR